MCGVAGGVGSVTPEIEQAVRLAGEAQRHRGPDDRGDWRDVEAGRGAVLDHRRLAIIDLSAAGRQPMIDTDNGNALCFNGEIYNFRELRAELENDGVRFQTQTDSEVLLKAYGVWGLGVLARLRGMFAFALWDRADRTLLLARDRLGIKPLYLCECRPSNGERTLLFASELRALLASGLVERRICSAALESYLWNGFVVGPQTLVSGVRALDAGMAALVDERGTIAKEWRYWSLPDAGGGASLEDLRAELEEAVALRLVSDVPLGVFLSGGVDSSAVAALAARSRPSQLQTFCVGFDEEDFDESDFARKVAGQLGAEHRDIRLTQQGFLGRLDDALASLDQPTFDGVNSYFVSHAVRDAGITVALSGAGGDELFGGYSSFAELPRAAAWARWLRPFPVSLLRGSAGAGSRLRSGAGKFPSQTRWGKLGDALATRGNLAELYQVSYALFTEEFAQRLYPGEREGDRGLERERLAELDTISARNPTLHAISLFELRSFIGERLLRDIDSTAMAVSLEVRVPLIDHRVVECAARLAEAERFQPLGRKQALRNAALGDVGPTLFDRPKMGFELPFDRWCRGDLRPRIEAAFADRAGCEAAGLAPDAVADLWKAFLGGQPGLYWSRVWALFALLHWRSRHRVSL